MKEVTKKGKIVKSGIKDLAEKIDIDGGCITKLYPQYADRKHRTLTILYKRQGKYKGVHPKLGIYR